jgi:hypothetical protein
MKGLGGSKNIFEKLGNYVYIYLFTKAHNISYIQIHVL